MVYCLAPLENLFYIRDNKSSYLNVYNKSNYKVDTFKEISDHEFDLLVEIDSKYLKSPYDGNIIENIRINFNDIYTVADVSLKRIGYTGYESDFFEFVALLEVNKHFYEENKKEIFKNLEENSAFYSERYLLQIIQIGYFANPNFSDEFVSFFTSLINLVPEKRLFITNKLIYLVTSYKQQMDFCYFIEHNPDFKKVLDQETINKTIEDIYNRLVSTINNKTSNFIQLHNLDSINEKLFIISRLQYFDEERAKNTFEYLLSHGFFTLEDICEKFENKDESLDELVKNYVDITKKDENDKIQPLMLNEITRILIETTGVDYLYDNLKKHQHFYIKYGFFNYIYSRLMDRGRKLNSYWSSPTIELYLAKSEPELIQIMDVLSYYNYEELIKTLSKDNIQKSGTSLLAYYFLEYGINFLSKTSGKIVLTDKLYKLFSKYPSFFLTTPKMSKIATSHLISKLQSYEINEGNYSKISDTLTSLIPLKNDEIVEYLKNPKLINLIVSHYNYYTFSNDILVSLEKYGYMEKIGFKGRK